MTVEDLIRELTKMPRDAIVYAINKSEEHE